MRLKHLLIVAAGGLILGGVEGFLGSLYNIGVERYLQYGMFRLVALDLSNTLTSHVIIFGVLGLILYMFSLLLIMGLRIKRDRALELAAVVVILVAVALPLGQLLQSYSVYTPAKVYQALTAKLNSVVSGELSFAKMLSRLRAHKAEAAIFLAPVPILILLYMLVRRLDWDRLLDYVRRHYRGFLKAGASVAGVTLALNFSLLIDGVVNMPRGPNIVVLVVDCLRADHIGCYGYGRDTTPSIDKMAQGGVVFEHAYANGPWTKPSVGTAFTSLYPNVHSATDVFSLLPRQTLTVAEILRNGGYRTWFLNGGNPSIQIGTNFEQGFGRYIGLAPADRCDSLTARFLSLARAPGRRPFFAYVHYMDAHLPYNSNPYNHFFAEAASDTAWTPGEVILERVRGMTQKGALSDEAKRQLVAIYDGQIRSVDESIGRIIDYLSTGERLDNTLIIVTADHGEEFWDHNNFEHGHSVYNELLHIPLIIHGAGLQARWITGPVCLADMLPTLLDLAGLPRRESGIAGISLAPVLTDGEQVPVDRPMFATGTLFGISKASVLEGNWKLISNNHESRSSLHLTGYENGADLELYDVAGDPGEKTNLKDTHSEVVRNLGGRLGKLLAIESRFGSQETKGDAELRKKLKALGYL